MPWSFGHNWIRGYTDLYFPSSIAKRQYPGAKGILDGDPVIKGRIVQIIL